MSGSRRDGMIAVGAWADVPITHAYTTGQPVVRRAAWCVQHREGWCATEDGKKPTEDAWVDITACGHSVTLRIGSAKREPDCAECLAALAAKESER